MTIPTSTATLLRSRPRTTVGSGTVAINADGARIDYTPATNFSGTDTVTYTISDGNGGTDTGTVTITVTAVNDAPVAVNDSEALTEDDALTSITVLDDDTDVDGDPHSQRDQLLRNRNRRH